MNLSEYIAVNSIEGFSLVGNKLYFNNKVSYNTKSLYYKDSIYIDSSINSLKEDLYFNGGLLFKSSDIPDRTRGIRDKIIMLDVCRDMKFDYIKAEEVSFRGKEKSRLLEISNLESCKVKMEFVNSSLNRTKVDKFSVRNSNISNSNFRTTSLSIHQSKLDKCIIENTNMLVLTSSKVAPIDLSVNKAGGILLLGDFQGSVEIEWCNVLHLDLSKTTKQTSLTLLGKVMVLSVFDPRNLLDSKVVNLDLRGFSYYRKEKLTFKEMQFLHKTCRENY